jgi:hypothetical protein
MSLLPDDGHFLWHHQRVFFESGTPFPLRESYQWLMRSCMRRFLDSVVLDKASDKWKKFQKRYDALDTALSEASRRYWLNDAPENRVPFNAAGSDWANHRWCFQLKP